MNELFHHGVKGQQWGVRHGPPYPVDKENSITTIKKGTSFHRLSIRDENAATGHAYVTYLKKDTRHYQGFFGARLKAMNNNATVYSIDMTAKTDMLAPSKKRRAEAFVELYKSDPIIAKELGNYHKSDWHYITPLPKKFYQYQYSKLNEEKLRTKGYDTFVRSIGDQNPYIRNAYFKKLAEEGYSFVTDDMDAGRFGEAPSIIFDRQKSVDYSGQKELSGKDINKIWKEEGTYIKNRR